MDTIIKRCSVCKQDKPDSEYDRTTKDGRLAAFCKTCRATKKRRAYSKNKGTYRGRAKLGADRLRSKKRAWVLNYLLIHPCTHCGLTNIRVLEFHHVDPETKECTVCSLMYRSCSLERVKAEVAKCVVLCANCHNIQTSKDQKWWTNHVIKIETFTISGIKTEYCPKAPEPVPVPFPINEGHTS